MSYVEDVAGSGAASWADSFSSLLSFTFGSKNINFGASQKVTSDARQSQDATTSSDARANASTAKADGGSTASATATLSEMADAAGINLKTLGIGAGALAVVWVIYKLITKKKPAKRKK
jgi:hypothetical protein